MNITTTTTEAEVIVDAVDHHKGQVCVVIAAHWFAPQDLREAAHYFTVLAAALEKEKDGI